MKKFVDRCVILRAFWIYYQTMFQGSDLKRELLQNTAPKFFNDLNSILIEHLVLKICALTDPDVTGKSYNLTVQFLVNNADFSVSSKELAKLMKVADRICRFRRRILPARNKLIGHFDLDAALGRKSLGGASIAAWRRFWLDLQDVVAIMHKRYVDKRTPFCLNSISMISDADQLLMALKESTYFRVLIDDKLLTRKASHVALGSKYYDI